MAKIGLKYPVYKGTAAGVLGKGVKADITIEMNDVELYADDGLAESYKGFKKGSITLETSNMTKTDKALLLGKTVVGNLITSNAADVYPYVGFGFYGAELIDGVISYRAIWLPKVQFSEPADSNSTKGETLSFGTHSLPGTILKDATGNYKKEESFAVETDAIAWLNVFTGLPAIPSGGLTALSLVGAAGVLSPAFGVAIRSYTFGGVTAVSVTITATAAAHTIKLYEVIAGVDTYVQDIVSGTASAALAQIIGSKLYKIVAFEAAKASQTTFVTVVKVS